jgi:hypothetical protein
MRVWVSWLASGKHLGWYVTFQRPYRRMSLGIEAMDLMLDIVIEPGLSWRWKDREEFDEIAGRGIFDPDVVGRVEDEARSVVGRIEVRWSSNWRPGLDGGSVVQAGGRAGAATAARDRAHVTRLQHHAAPSARRTTRSRKAVRLVFLGPCCSSCGRAAAVCEAMLIGMGCERTGGAASASSTQKAGKRRRVSARTRSRLGRRSLGNAR